MDAYKANGEFVQTFRTIATDDVVRFDDGLGTDGVMGPGWFIYGLDKSESGMYVSDAQPDAISMIHIDGTGYSGGDTLVRVDAPEWAEGIGDVAGADENHGSISSDTAQVNEVLEGWWVDQGTGAYIKHISGGKVREYLDFGNGRYEGGDKAVDVVAERFDSAPADGMPNGPGWSLRLAGPDNSLVHYLSEGNTETLYCTGFDGAAHPEGYLVKMQPPEALVAYAAAKEGGATSTGQVRLGEVEFAGTVVATTYAQRQADLGLPESTGFAGNHEQLVFLQLYSELEVNGLNGDHQGRSTRPVSTVLLGPEWASRAGERVDIAVAEEDLEWFSDTKGALVSISVRDNNVREL